MIRKALAFLSILFVFLLASCRPQAEFPPSVSHQPLWEEFFQGFWDKMNAQYAFWYLDSPDDEWNSVYEEYMPQFIDLEGIIGESSETTDLACRYFYDIVKNLSDCHYSLRVTDGESWRLVFSKYMYNLLLDNGYTDDEIFSFFTEGNQPTLYELTERIDSILKDTFKVNISGETLGQVTPGAYLAECNVIYKPGKTYDSCYIFGRTSDNILYLGLSDFCFSDYMNEREAQEFISLWRTAIEDYLSGEAGKDINGIIIDLRGNTGGYNADLPLFWNCLFSEDVYFADTLGKDGMNRLDYGPWVKYIIHGGENTSRDFDKPIAVLINKGTVSNGEISTLLFMALRDYYGFNVSVFGEDSAGGLGTAFIDNNDNQISPFEDPYVFNAGQFNIGYIVGATQNRSTRYRNGEVYENTGITPDTMTEAGNATLDAALKWIRAEI